MRSLYIAALLMTTFFIQSCVTKQKIDTLIIHATVYTVDDSFSTTQAIAIKEGKILNTGSTEELSAMYHAKQVIDADGKYIFPGFIDAHCHFYGLARSLQWVDLIGTDSFDEVLDRISLNRKKNSSQWVIGRGWDHNDWDSKEFPDKRQLDSLFPETPVVLIRIDGHVLLANQTALNLAGISADHHFQSGEVEIENELLTGILSENAADHVKSLIPSPDDQILLGLFEQAEEMCFGKGLTGVTDAGLERNTLLFIDSIQKEGRLKIPVNAMLSPSKENLAYYLVNGPFQSERLSIRAVKLYADGSLGSRTALLKRPYTDDPAKNGIMATDPDSIRAICQLAKDFGYQVCTHCIGDSANHMILNIYGEFLQGKNDLRWRIEHAQVVDPADFILFEQFSVIPSVQATHATSDMYWAENRLGPLRIQGAYAYKKLLEQNGWLPNGTDFPIERISPLLTFYAAVARQDLEGFPSTGFHKEQALSREEALRSITIWAARSNFAEQLRGSIEPGKWADLVILDQDILAIPDSALPNVHVLRTFIHGEQVWEQH